jgi:class 3 adenylate cyclase
MDHPPSFGRILRERRKVCDLTQEQLAEKVSYSVETIKKIEAGKLRPGKQLAERLADCLELREQERAAFLHAARAVIGSLRPALPQGTVTFLFTDIEGSTRLWEQYPQAMQSVLARHDAMLRQAIEEYGGMVFKTVGDAFHAVFARAQDALAAAVAAQRALYAEDWNPLGALRVRIALLLV